MLLGFLIRFAGASWRWTLRLGGSGFGEGPAPVMVDPELRPLIVREDMRKVAQCQGRSMWSFLCAE